MDRRDDALEFSVGGATAKENSETAVIARHHGVRQLSVDCYRQQHVDGNNLCMVQIGTANVRKFANNYMKKIAVIAGTNRLGAVFHPKLPVDLSVIT